MASRGYNGRTMSALISDRQLLTTYYWGGGNGRTMSPLISDLSSWPVRSVSMNCEGRVGVKVGFRVRVGLRVSVSMNLNVSKLLTLLIYLP